MKKLRLEKMRQKIETPFEFDVNENHKIIVRFIISRKSYRCNDRVWIRIKKKGNKYTKLSLDLSMEEYGELMENFKKFNNFLKKEIRR